MAGLRGLRLLMLAAGSVGGLSGAAYGLLNGQSRRARSIIGGVPKDLPPNADGVYLPNGAGPLAARWGDVLTFAVLGDSLAAGLGAESPDALPGVLLAKGLAEETGRPVRLTTHAISGAKTSELPYQADRALIDPPELALVIIGGNDVTGQMRIGTSAGLLIQQVTRLIKAGTTVVVGTCPDLGVVQPIPQPLRTIAQQYSLALGRAQRRELDRIGVAAVSIADLISPEFLARPAELFAADRFHPNGTGYELAAGMLLAPLCAAIGAVAVAVAGVRPAVAAAAA